MANIFSIPQLAGVISQAKDRAIALAGEYGLSDVIAGHVLPTLPPYPASAPVSIAQADGFDVEAMEATPRNEVSYTIFGTPMCFPLSIKLSTENTWWLLPTEPIISLGGRHELVRRKVAKRKGRGTVKTSWSQDDYSISIDGLFTKVDDWTYPEADVIRLTRILESRQPIDVKCQLFEYLSIGRIAVEDWEIPFTKGEENQAYRIKAWSDDDFSLFIKPE